MINKYINKRKTECLLKNIYKTFNKLIYIKKIFENFIILYNNLKKLISNRIYI